MTRGAISSLPPAFVGRDGFADAAHRAAYAMQGRIPQIRRALTAVGRQVGTSGARIAPTRDAWLGAVQDAMTGAPLDVHPGVFKQVLGEWIEQGLFGLEDPTKVSEPEDD